MAIDDDEVELFRKNARESHHFFVKPSRMGIEFFLAKTEETRKEQRRIIAETLAPILRASTQVTLYQSDALADDWPEPEKTNIQRIVKKSGQSLVVDLTLPDLINGLEEFWAGGHFDLIKRRGWARGTILFIVDDSKLDTKQLFSKCTRAGVVSNSRSALGAALYRRAMAVAESGGQSTAIALGDAGSLSKFTLFARGERFEQLLQESIDCVRWYE